MPPLTRAHPFRPVTRGNAPIISVELNNKTKEQKNHTSIVEGSYAIISWANLDIHRVFEHY